MSLQKIITAGILGTSAMTLFSYLVSELDDDNFKEPLLLKQLMQRVGTDEETAIVTAWVLHYAIGISFVAAYELIRKSKSQPTVKQGAAMGLVCGGIGIAVWKAVLKLHPAPPKNNRKRYYAQLLAAHVIFGITMAMYYQHSRHA